MKGYDSKYLRDIILNFVIAGKDTTAATLSWFMYMLCKYPAVQEKAAEEVKEATNTKTISSYTEFASRVTDEALEKMNYLHAVITETLRLYPAVPVVRLSLRLNSSFSSLHAVETRLHYCSFLHLWLKLQIPLKVGGLGAV